MNDPLSGKNFEQPLLNNNVNNSNQNPKQNISIYNNDNQYGYQPITSTANPNQVLSEAAINPQNRPSYPSKNEVMGSDFENPNFQTYPTQTYQTQNYPNQTGNNNPVNKNINSNNLNNNNPNIINTIPSVNPNINLNEIGVLQNKLLFIENRLSNFGYFLSWLYTMLVFNTSSIFYNISYFSSSEFYDREYKHSEGRTEIFNFLINVLYILGYILGIQSFLKQDRDKSNIFHITLIVFCGISIGYFLLYFFVRASFFSWCSNTFYLVINLVLYYQHEEFIKFIEEKRELRRKYDTISF